MTWATSVNWCVDWISNRCRTVIREREAQVSGELRNARDPGPVRPSHQQIAPPSTMRLLPVQYDDASLSRNVTGPTISSASAHRPSGMSFA